MPAPRRRAFTLVELLIVVTIIAVLMALLMPALVRARRQANTVVCLSQLRQLAVVLNEYMAANKGRAPYHVDGILGLLIPPNDTTTYPEIVVCPEAQELGPLVNGAGQTEFYLGTAHHAWGTWYARPPAISVPWWGLRTSSYGRNFWTCSQAPGYPPEWELLLVSPRTAQADSVPLLADARDPDPAPRPTDTPPTNLTGASYIESGWPLGMRSVCIARHGRAINILFLDGHAATTRLEELWKLKWHNEWARTDVTLPPQ
jgi:prepilin-type N-terminal cleavage/methylation domain-containing protein/prepilin-type processing-associated H-X9-DG protein